MEYNEVIVGHRVLVQSGQYVKEHAEVKDILDNGKVLVRLADGNLTELLPQYILKSFGF